MTRRNRGGWQGRMRQRKWEETNVHGRTSCSPSPSVRWGSVTWPCSPGQCMTWRSGLTLRKPFPLPRPSFSVQTRRGSIRSRMTPHKLVRIESSPPNPLSRSRCCSRFRRTRRGKVSINNNNNNNTSQPPLPTLIREIEMDLVLQKLWFLFLRLRRRLQTMPNLWQRTRCGRGVRITLRVARV